MTTLDLGLPVCGSLVRGERGCHEGFHRHVRHERIAVSDEARVHVKVASLRIEAGLELVTHHLIRDWLSVESFHVNRKLRQRHPEEALEERLGHVVWIQVPYGFVYVCPASLCRLEYGKSPDVSEHDIYPGHTVLHQLNVYGLYADHLRRAVVGEVSSVHVCIISCQRVWCVANHGLPGRVGYVVSAYLRSSQEIDERLSRAVAILQDEHLRARAAVSLDTVPGTHFHLDIHRDAVILKPWCPVKVITNPPLVVAVSHFHVRLDIHYR